MLLAIDVGNTNIVLGVFDGATLDPELAAADAARADVRRARPAGRRPVRAQPDRARADPRRDPRLGRAAADRHDPRRWSSATSASPRCVVEPGVNTGMPILYENPAEVGADRIVNAVAAYEKFGKAPAAGRPMIVVDFGTATTLDAVSAKGEYLGGAICPGVQISADALFQRAARLPRIDVRKPARGRRPDDGRRDGVGPVLRLRRDGRRAGPPDERRARRQRAVRRDRRPRRRHRAGDLAASSTSTPT